MHLDGDVIWLAELVLGEGQLGAELPQEVADAIGSHSTGSGSPEGRGAVVRSATTTAVGWHETGGWLEAREWLAATMLTVSWLWITHVEAYKEKKEIS